MINTSINIPDASFPKKTMNGVERTIRRNFRRSRFGAEGPQSIVLLGPPGTGKTYIFTHRECLPTWYAEYLTERDGVLVEPEDIAVIVVRVAEKDGQELAGPGVPREDEHGNVFFVFSQAPTITEMEELGREIDGEWVPYEYFILVLDELSSSGEDVQKVVANLLHTDDRTLGGDKISDNCFVVATGNLPSNMSGAGRMLAHLVDRPKVCIVEFEIDGWVNKFARPNNICPIVIEFMIDHWQDVICKDVPMDYGNFCSARSMTEASYDLAAWIADPEFNGTVPSDVEEDLAMNIGLKAARLLADYVEQAGEVARPEDVFANPETAPVSDNIGFQHMSASAALNAVTDMSEATAALQYIMRLRTDLLVSLGVKLHDVLMRPEFEDEIIVSPVWQQFHRDFGSYLNF